MKFSFSQAVFCVMLTLGILMGLEGRGNAASIVQVVDYRFQEHDTSFGYYQQFNPSLGTLLEVMIQCQGSFYSSGAFTFSNLTSVDQTFTGTLNYGENSDAGSSHSSNSFTLTLAPRQYVNEDISGSYALSTSYGTNPFWVGTELLGPDQFASQHGPISTVSAQSNNPNIFIDSEFNDPYAFASDRGTETITFLYQPAGSAVPEPPAYMLLGTACLLLLAFRYSLLGCARPFRTPGQR